MPARTAARAHVLVVFFIGRIGPHRAGKPRLGVRPKWKQSLTLLADKWASLPLFKGGRRRYREIVIDP
jgi:hypothetical protein